MQALTNKVDLKNMRVSVEITSRFGRRLTIVVPAEEIDEAIKSRTQRVAGTIRMKGFRQGKVPSSIVEQRHGLAIRHEVIDEIFQSSLRQAITQEKLMPAGRPVIQSMKTDPGSPFEYSVIFEVMPDISIPDISQIAVEKLVVSVEDSDIKKVLEQIQKQSATWEEVTRPVQMGDKVTGEIIGFKEGQPDPNRYQKSAFFIMDDQAIKSGLSPLKNAKLGDEVECDIQFKPESTSDKLQTKIKIHKIEAPILPTLDDKFASLLGIKEGGIDALRRELRTQLEDRAENIVKQKLKTQIMDKLIENNTVEFPPSMLDEEYQRLETQMRKEAEQRNPSSKDTQLSENERQNLMSVAKKRVILGLLLPAIIKEKKIVLDEARLQQHVNKVINNFENPEVMMKALRNNQELLSYIRSQVLEEQVVEALLAQVKQTEKKVSYSEVMEFPISDETHFHEHDRDHVHDEHCNH